MDLGTFLLVHEVEIPSVSPVQLLLFAEVDTVCVRDRKGSVLAGLLSSIERKSISVSGKRSIGDVDSRNKLQAILDILQTRRKAVCISVGCFDGLGIDFESDYDLLTLLTSTAGCSMVANNESDVVVDEVSGLASSRVKVVVSHFEARCIVLPALVDCHEAGGSRQVVDYPLSHIALLDNLDGLVHASTVDLVAAEVVQLIVLAHLQFVVRDHDPVASQDFSQVESNVGAGDEAGAMSLSAARGADEGKLRVGVLDLGVVAVDLVDKERNRVAVLP